MYKISNVVSWVNSEVDNQEIIEHSEGVASFNKGRDQRLGLYKSVWHFFFARIFLVSVPTM